MEREREMRIKFNHHHASSAGDGSRERDKTRGLRCERNFHKIFCLCGSLIRKICYEALLFGSIAARNNNDDAILVGKSAFFMKFVN
jgi:hypothetical protein